MVFLDFCARLPCVTTPQKGITEVPAGAIQPVPSFRQAENYTGNLVMDTNLTCSAVFDHGNKMSKNDLSHLEKQ